MEKKLLVFPQFEVAFLIADLCCLIPDDIWKNKET